MDLKPIIRDVVDFPKPGIVFKDITPLLANPEAFKYAVDRMTEFARKQKTEAVLAAEARGYLFGPGIACNLGVPLLIVRKAGKLPHKTIAHTYVLEYGTDTLEIHEDSIEKGRRVLLVDDLLATGGTIEACAKLVEKLGGVVAGCAFVIELSFLHGRDKLKGYDIFTMIDYEGE